LRGRPGGQGDPGDHRSGYRDGDASGHRAEVPAGAGRLVPLDLVDATADGIRLRCTVEEFGRLEAAEETEVVDGLVGGLALVRRLTSRMHQSWWPPVRSKIDCRAGTTEHGCGFR
jgi:hypothetical protein